MIWRYRGGEILRREGRSITCGSRILHTRGGARCETNRAKAPLASWDSGSTDKAGAANPRFSASAAGACLAETNHERRCRTRSPRIARITSEKGSVAAPPELQSLLLSADGQLQARAASGIAAGTSKLPRTRQLPASPDRVALSSKVPAMFMPSLAISVTEPPS